MAKKWNTLGRILLAPTAFGVLGAPYAQAQAPQPQATQPTAQPAVAESPAAQPVAESPGAVVQDVALADDGVLRGILVTAENAPLTQARVQIWMQEHEVASTQTDSAGRFAVRGLRGGAYQIVAGDAAMVCRLWAPGTAPPHALKTIVLVQGTNVVRGDLLPWYDWCMDPLLVSGLVATAIAVPLILHDDDDEPSSP